MSKKPRTRPPISSGSPRLAQEPGPRPLRGSVLLVWGEKARQLREGEYVLGRSPECDVVIDHPLVSRQHAKISVLSIGVLIEDLLSANGVYVNGVRVARSQQLFDGDRILLSTCEISVFDAPRPEASDVEQGHAQRGQDLPAGGSAVDTDRADPFLVVGPMADELLASGRVVAAERVLSDHISKLLEGARASLTVPADVCETAGCWAMKLAKATRDGHYINQAVELHMRCRRVMTGPVLDLLSDALGVVTRIDVGQFRYYVEVLRKMSDRMSPAELDLVDRLDRLPLPRDKGSGVHRPGRG